jgi:bifunctional non-homologous end joining protein LigD
MTEHAPILPQRATPARAVVTSLAWVFEPYWEGDRLIASLRDGRISLTDAAGQPAGPELAPVAQLLADAVDAEQAVIDAIWTLHALVEDEPVPDVPGAGDAQARAPRHSLVAIDLVELDGQSLTDIPYQERRRLLESVLAERGRVRISPAVRQPVARWLLAWRALGFSRCVAKHVNSRYHPGQQTDDWLILPSEPIRPPSILSGMFGRRPKPVRRIED